MAFIPLDTRSNGQDAVAITGEVKFNPTSAAVDAFGRARVSDPFTIFDAQFHRDKHPLLFDEAVAGGASAAVWNSTEHVVDLTLGTASGESIVRQSYQYHRYQPGKSQLVLCTFVAGAVKANVRKRVGYFDANNGLFLEVAGGDVAVVQRNNTDDTQRVAQADWNVDPMDGTGPSRVTLDWSKAQILAVDLEWLGVGATRFAFVVDGVIYPVHKFGNANTLATTYMQTANLPIRYEIENTGVAASGSTLKQICASVISEGGFNPLSISRAVDNAPVGKTITTSQFTPLVSIRLKAADIRSQIVPTLAGFSTTATQEYLIRLVLNGALTGASWVDVGAESITEFDITASDITGGETLFSFPTSQDAQLVAPIEKLVNRLGASIAGTADILTLAARQRAGGPSSAFSSLNFDERF